MMDIFLMCQTEPSKHFTLTQRRSETQATMSSRLRGIAVVGAVVASGLAVVHGGPVNTLPMAYSGALPGDDQVLWAVVWGPTHPKKMMPALTARRL
jgi:hypothetical protein